MSTQLPHASIGAPPAAAVPPAGELVAKLSAQLSTLVRSEAKLASVEVKSKVKPLGMGIGMFAGAGVIVLYAVNVLLAAAVIALALLLPLWLSALIVGVVLLVVAGILALVGKKLVSRGTPPVPTQAIDSVKKDVAVIKGAAHR